MCARICCFAVILVFLAEELSFAQMAVPDPASEELSLGPSSPTSERIWSVCPKVKCYPWFTVSSKCQPLPGYSGAYECYDSADACLKKECQGCIVRFTTPGEAQRYCNDEGIDLDCILCKEEPYICWYKPTPTKITIHKCVKDHKRECHDDCKNGVCKIIDCNITIKKLEKCDIDWCLACQFVDYKTVWIVINCKCPPIP